MTSLSATEDYDGERPGSGWKPRVLFSLLERYEPLNPCAGSRTGASSPSIIFGADGRERVVNPAIAGAPAERMAPPQRWRSGLRSATRRPRGNPKAVGL